MLRTAQLIFLLSVVSTCALSQPLPPGAPAVVITEIMYDLPGSGSDSLEFIELRNPSAVNERSLAGYRFLAGIEFSFIGNILVQPHEFVVVAKDSVAFENAFGIPAYQWINGDLDDDGELIVLGNGNIGVDSVAYSNTGLWPASAAGLGHSLEFCNDSLNNAIPLYWSASNTNAGFEVDGLTIFASPGDICSVNNSIDQEQHTSIAVYPNPNSGMLYVNGVSGAFSLTIFDLNGKQVLGRSNLNSNTVIDLEGIISAGIYFAHISAEDKHWVQRIYIME